MCPVTIHTWAISNAQEQRKVLSALERPWDQLLGQNETMLWSEPMEVDLKWEMAFSAWIYERMNLYGYSKNNKRTMKNTNDQITSMFAPHWQWQ